MIISVKDNYHSLCSPFTVDTQLKTYHSPQKTCVDHLCVTNLSKHAVLNTLMPLQYNTVYTLSFSIQCNYL